MPEEIITNPTPEVITTPSSVESVDRGLEAALEKRFKNYTPENNETPKEEPKVEEKSQEKEPQKEITIELKKPSKEASKEVKSDAKPVDEEKPLPNPEAIEESPQGKGQAAWNALKNNYKRSFKSIESKDQEITKLKASLAEKSTLSQKETETLKSQIEDLSKYRAMVDIQADPEFVSKFDNPINEKVQSMKDLLKGWNVSEAQINTINFLDKNTVGTIARTLRENEKSITNEFELEEFISNAKEVLELNKKRDKELKSQGENYKQLLETKKKESFNKEAEGEGRIIKHLQNIAQAKDATGNSVFPFLSKTTPKEGASQLEIDQINNHNNMVDLSNQKIQSVFKMNTPEERAEVAVAAVASYYLSAQLKAANAKINSLQESLKKISSSGSETEKVKPVNGSRNGNAQPVRVGDALNSFFPNRG